MNRDATNDLITKGIELYTGETVEKLERVNDPRVTGSAALRVKFVPRAKCANKNTYDFVLVASNELAAFKTPEEIEAHLSETKFETWPPKSSWL